MYCTDSEFRFVYKAYRGKYNNMSDSEYLRRLFKIRVGYELNLENPRSFNEKIQWLKLHDRNEKYVKLVDKYEVKEYIANKFGRELVIPTLGVWDRFEQINFNDLPDKFVLKCTHDSGGVVICTSKLEFDVEKAKKTLNRCLKHNFYWSGREYPYKQVKPRIIAEKYLVDDSKSGALNDYKLMCFNGKVECGFVCSNRFGEGGLYVNFYDRDWNSLPFIRKYPKDPIEIQKPALYDKMVLLAEKMSEGIPFVRIDFYEIENKIYFGEFTFYPGSGMEWFDPIEWDYKLGDLLTLPELNKA